MRKFVKKAVQIEAAQFLGDNAMDIIEWAKKNGATIMMSNDSTLLVHTLEGVMTATAGSWIIRGVAGEFYPCADAIFRATYDEVQE
jgi:hypothetical protein